MMELPTGTERDSLTNGFFSVNISVCPLALFISSLAKYDPDEAFASKVAFQCKTTLGRVAG